MHMHRRHKNALMAVLLTSSTALSQAQIASPNEYWASCAAAMTQKTLILEELEKKDASSLYPAIGHYYRLACAFSTPMATSEAYERGRASQMDSFKLAASQCRTDSQCLARFVQKLDGQLLICAGEQKRQADLIASVTRVVNEGCNVDVKP